MHVFLFSVEISCLLPPTSVLLSITTMGLASMDLFIKISCNITWNGIRIFPRAG